MILGWIQVKVVIFSLPVKILRQIIYIVSKIYIFYNNKVTKV